MGRPGGGHRVRAIRQACSVKTDIRQAILAALQCRDLNTTPRIGECASGCGDEADALWQQVRAELLARMNGTAAAAFLWLRLAGDQITDDDEPVARAYVQSQRRNAADSTYLEDALNRHGRVLMKVGRIDEAFTAFRDRVAVSQRLFGPTHPYTLRAGNSLAWFLVEAGRPAEAEPIARAAVEAYRRAESPDHNALINTLDTLAMALCDLDRLDDAEAVFSELSELWMAAHNAQKPLRESLQLHYGQCLLKLKRFEEAEPLLLAALRDPGDDRPAANRREQAAQSLIELYEASGRPESAAEHRRAAPP